jgi:hypothetical protein
LTVDQFRPDYLERYAGQLTGGLARLQRAGARFTNAHHDHAITETAPGHASLLSGRFPRSTRIMMNRTGVEDRESPLIAGGYGPGASPRRFEGTTLADWMRAADRRTRVLSVSMKDRGAILPIGRSRSDVYWYSLDGRFLTSRYYRDQLPPWVRAFNEQRRVPSYAGQTWDLLLPDSAYAEPDSVPLEMHGRRFTFPHRLTDDIIDVGAEIRLTPFIDDLVVDFALAGVHALDLGQRDVPDLLAVSVSATDVIGHNYGPDSREIHDQVLRLDRTLGRFLDSLYARVDSSRTLIVLTSDHGVGPIPELAARTMKPPPYRVSMREPMQATRRFLQQIGVDTFALELDNEVLLSNRAAFRTAHDIDSALTVFATAARTVPGVLRVDRFAALMADTVQDDIARRWAHQFPARSNVELTITLTPFSSWGGNIASHGSPHGYDSHVPLIFAGAGIQPGEHQQFVRTVDIGPTLAAELGVRIPERVDGVRLPLRRPVTNSP